MKTLYLILLFLSLSVNSYSQRLSEISKISILTCGSGNELYSIFGHTAIRVLDPSQDLDVVYNYGTFAFSEDFYIKFIQGKLNYFLSTDDFNSFVEEYSEENRSITEQVLNLSQEDKQKIYLYLEWNLQPENRYYLYDFFYDNCATREIDVLQKSLCDNLILPQNAYETSNYSFRDLINPYLVSMPWSDFGIDLGLGARTDKSTTFLEHTFLPLKLNEFLKGCKININGTIHPLIAEDKEVFRPESDAKSSVFFLIPTFLFWSLFLAVLIISIFEFNKRKIYGTVDFMIFLVLGLLGSLLLFLWSGTDHTFTGWNWNLLWASPAHLLFAVFAAAGINRRIVFIYVVFTLFVSGLLMSGWFFLPQQLHPAVFPILLMVVVRMGLRGKIGNKNS